MLTKWSHWRNQNGFTLVEVLVALVVLSIGLLGMAAMQVTSLQSNREAYLRTQAAFAAYDILDRIRANNASLASYEVAKGAKPPAASSCEGASANCSSAQIVGYDLAQWKCSLGKWNDENTCTTTFGIRGDIPEGDGSIEIDGRDVVVTVFYEDQQGDEQSLAVSSEF